MKVGRLLWFVVIVAAVVAGLVLRPLGGGNDGVGAALPPDLWTSDPFQLNVTDIDGRAVLRFTSEVNNRGEGDLILRGNPKTSAIDQWVEHAESGHTVESLDVEVAWGGDTHDHWHIEDVARYWIAAPDGTPVGESFDNKVGFCIFDSVDFQSESPRAPDSVRYRISGCGTQLSDQVAMGLSVGWGDQYRFDLSGQYIDIEDLAPGRYLLMAAVDPDGLLIEADTTNNEAATPFTLEVDGAGNRIVRTEG